MFASEQVLVERFVEVLDRGPWGALQLAREFFYYRGRTDLVGVSTTGEVIAFEAKLLKWRSALHQAYRNRCYAHQSYVLLPPRQAEAAARYEAEFNRRGIGICTVVADGVMIMRKAEAGEPIQPWLSRQAVEVASGA